MKTIFFLTGIFLLFLITPFPSSHQDSTESYRNPQKSLTKTFGLVLPTSTNPLYKSIEEGARLAEVALDIHLHVKTGTKETSISQQMSIVRDLAKNGADAIIMIPISSEIIPVLKEVTDSGVHIVLVVNPLNKEQMGMYGLDTIPYVGVDNKHASKEAVDTILPFLRLPSDALIITGIPHNEISRLRAEGAKEAFENHPLIQHVYSCYSNFQIEDAKIYTEQYLKQYPSIRVIFASTDMIAIGVDQYLQEAGRNDILLCSFDGTPIIKDLVEQGKIVISIDQHAVKQGFEAVRTADMMQRMDMSSYEKIVSYEIDTAPDIKR